MGSVKRIVPFSNGTEAMIWMNNNCDECKTRRGCAGKKNIELGFLLGDISGASAILIGMTNGRLSPSCQMKSKRKLENRAKRLNDDSLIF